MEKQEIWTCLYSQEHLMRFHRAVESHKMIFINASFGWCKSDFIQEYLERVYKKPYFWMEDGQTCMQMHKLCSAQDEPSFFVLRNFERIASGEHLENVLDCIKQLSKSHKIIILSSVPVPQKMLPLTLDRSFLQLGEKQLRLSRNEVGNFFRSRGIVLSDFELVKVEQDFENMPLSLKILFNCLQEQETEDSSLAISRCREDVYSYVDLCFFQTLSMEAQNTLLRLAYFDIISEGLLESAFDMRQEMSKKLLEEVCSRGSILKPVKSGGYEFYPLLRRFLRRYVEKYVDMTERVTLYKKAANYYIGREEYKRALVFISILKEEYWLAECLNHEMGQYPEPWEYRELEHYFRQISPKTVMMYPGLIAGRAVLESIYGNRKRAFQWYERLDERAFPVWARYMHKFLPAGLDGKWQVRIKEGGEAFFFQGRLDAFRVLNGDSPFLLYEKNQFDAAMEYIGQGLKTAKRDACLPAVLAGTAALCNVMLFSNQAENMDAALLTAEQMMEQDDNWLLHGNFKALLAWYNLILGDKEAVRRWMNRGAPNENESFCALLCFQYLIKVKVYLSQKLYVSAQNILNLLREYAVDFEMYYLELQVYILESVLYYRKGNPGYRDILDKALDIGEAMGLIRVFADEGAAVYPLLLKKSSEQEEKDRGAEGKSRIEKNSYLKSVMKAAKNTMLLYPRYLEQTQKVEHMSDAEMQVLRLLAHGMKNGEIARDLYVSENTVKYHLKNIYAKMGVKSRSQAVKTAVDDRLI